MEKTDPTGWLPLFEGVPIPDTPDSKLQYYRDFVEYQKAEIAALKKENAQLKQASKRHTDEDEEKWRFVSK